jgi:pimeloyl-ACP methyl ester carboxylesterase
MKKLIAGLVLLLAAISVGYGQDHSRTDYAVRQFQKYYNGKQPDSLFSQLSPRIKQLMPLDKVRDMVNQLQAQVGTFSGYEFYKQEGKMAYYHSLFSVGVSLTLIASVDSNGKLDIFRFVPDKKEEPAVQEKGASEISFANGDVILHGTLTVPETAGKVPVALLIAGSGPTDRNGNNSMGVSCDIYRILADSLRNAGIACVRYDKRGVGASMQASGSESNARFEDMIDDAAAIIKTLNADSRFSGVYVMGHSEGSLVGMVAAQKGGVTKYISLAGVGETADKILRVQLASMGSDVAKSAAIIMDSLKMGYDVRNVKQELFTVFRPAIQPYLRSWFRYDPCKEISQLKIPVMIVQGYKDMQVSETQAELLKKALPSAQLVTYSSMNHLLRDVDSDEENRASYHSTTMPLSAGLSQAIAAFIKK